MDSPDQRHELDLRARITIREAPAVIEELERRAFRAGHSVSDEVRAAVRQHLREPEPAA